MEPITLVQLNRMVSGTIRDAFPDTYWLAAEISDVRFNPNGHCYLEFIEKDPQTHTMVARAKGNIWNAVFRMLKPYFEQTTGQAFVSGIKVLVKVSIDFHELYGYALTVSDIDPSYTLGDMQRQRQLILRQLEEEGVLDLNKELEFPLFPQRIAIITSETAAGYEDFLDQIGNNPEGFVFYPRLFQANMQGEKTEESVIAALNRIYDHKELFDVVVIIRGGGSTSDLHCFDSYLLAANLAQFPLPVITGIGHERDETVLDFVANKRAKTPTAVATLLIDTMEESYQEILQIQSEIIDQCEERITSGIQQLQTDSYRLHANTTAILSRHKTALDLYRTSLRNASTRYFSQKRHQLEAIDQFLQLSSPKHILSKGYSITLKEGKAVKSATSLEEGDYIETVFAEGKSRSQVIQKS